MKGKLAYVDLCKGLGILMIMYGHITSLGNPIDMWMSSFKLPIFFIISGYLLGYKKTIRETTFKDFFIKNGKSIMVPYFWFSMIAIVYVIFIKWVHKADSKPIVLKYIYATITFRGISVMWFLGSLFFGLLLFYGFMRLNKYLKVLVFLIPLVTTYFAGKELDYLLANVSSFDFTLYSFPLITVTKAILSFWFVCIGYYSYDILEKVKGEKSKFLLGIVMSIATLILCRLNPGVDYNNMRLGVYPVLLYATGILGSLGALLVFQYLCKYLKFEFLNFAGKNSLAIMSTHTIIGLKAVAIHGWESIGTLSHEIGVRYYLECLIIMCILLLMEYALVKLIENKLLFLLGKERIIDSVKKWSILKAD